MTEHHSLLVSPPVLGFEDPESNEFCNCFLNAIDKTQIWL